MVASKDGQGGVNLVYKTPAAPLLGQEKDPVFIQASPDSIRPRLPPASLDTLCLPTATQQKSSKMVKFATFAAAAALAGQATAQIGDTCFLRRSYCGFQLLSGSGASKFP